MNTTVSFPGLGIGEFTMSRVAFTLFGRDVYWYGVIIMLGMVAAFIHATLRAKQEGIKTDDILDIGIWTVICGVIGARSYYVLTTLDEGGYHSFVDVIAIWDGGLAIYGGIIGGALAILGVCLYKHLGPLKVMDTIAPGVMIAQAMGRWGNFVNGEAYGYEVASTNPLYTFRMGIVSHFTGDEMKYYHPTFLYESLWNLVGFILITALYRKKKFNGQVMMAYFAWYGFGRMFIEGLRTDSLYVGPFRISQVVGALCFIGGMTAIIVCSVFVRRGKYLFQLAVCWAEDMPGTPATVDDGVAPVVNNAADDDDEGDTTADQTTDQGE